MTPELLREYLEVLKDADVVQAVLKTPDGEIHVVRAPSMPEPPAEVGPTGPGGWKTWTGPEHLDSLAGLEPDEPEIP